MPPISPKRTEKGSWPPKNCEKISSARSFEKPSPPPPAPLRPCLPNWSYVRRFSSLLRHSYASETFLKFSSASSLFSGFLSGWYLIASFLYACKMRGESRRWALERTDGDRTSGARACRLQTRWERCGHARRARDVFAQRRESLTVNAARCTRHRPTRQHCGDELCQASLTRA